jgi:hypothetical protein
MFERIANMLNTDTSTLWKSLFSGSTSTGAGIYITNTSLNWQFEANFINIAWALLTCILMTMVSLFITDCYKGIKAKIKEKRENKEKE